MGYLRARKTNVPRSLSLEATSFEASNVRTQPVKTPETRKVNQKQGCQDIARIRELGATVRGITGYK